MMNDFITWNINPKFELVHPGKLAINQLARNQNLLVTDERTSVKIFTGCGLVWCEQTLRQHMLNGVWFASIRVSRSLVKASLWQALRLWKAITGHSSGRARSYTRSCVSCQ